MEILYVVVFLICHNNQKFKLTLRDFRETNVAVPSVDTIAVRGVAGATAPAAPTQI
jgi:hypothetical protein